MVDISLSTPKGPMALTLFSPTANGEGEHNLVLLTLRRSVEQDGRGLGEAVVRKQNRSLESTVLKTLTHTRRLTRRH
ncbi:hypothetical protein Bpfe_006860 [Biomphalaria pfeifferi]|uniref:Uncharacterized protein n=1 Tax=Biomphalaria pfeifferi TaxID=112525 RepID=A0AAD8FHV2_BIOPF|nr:hypothetical protein Bpfe_006860 [Biomphalaria pfeifferi]